MTACRKGDHGILLDSVVKLLFYWVYILFLISRFIIFEYFWPVRFRKRMQGSCSKEVKEPNCCKIPLTTTSADLTQVKMAVFWPSGRLKLSNIWERCTHKLPVQWYHTKGGQWQTSIFRCVFHWELIQQQAILVPNAGDSSAFWRPEHISSILALGFF